MVAERSFHALLGGIKRTPAWVQCVVVMEGITFVKKEVTVENLIDLDMTPEQVVNQSVSMPPATFEHFVNVNSQLASAVTGLCQNVNDKMLSPTIAWSRPLPSITRFSGRLRTPNELDNWIRDAKECVARVGFQGSEAVAYLCGFLDRPALTRVRNSEVETVSDVFLCLENAFGVKLSYLELEQQLQSRVQCQNEGVWEFADSLVEIERKMQDRRVRAPDDRRWLLHMWFCRNLRDRKVGVRLQKWWEERPWVGWEELVQRAADKVNELEQIQREEAELPGKKLTGRSGRGVPTSKVCSICGVEGHLGFQCAKFEGGRPKKAGNGQP